MIPSRTDTIEYRAYLRARDAVVAMLESGGRGQAVDASAYWTEELANIDYLIEATPLVVRKLRQHAFHITGIRPYDYRTKGDGRREHFEARLRALQQLGGDSLLVPESPLLGGFGYEIDGRLYNVDTLKFYEVLIGMDRGGVLASLRRVERPVVCEIGAGWAGFAYQFKSLFPSATYVIVDFPELFLFSATYLGVQFPGARLSFCTGDTLPPDWRDADFVFVPQSRAALVKTMPLDAAVNMVSFQEMTEAQVREYARTIAAAGCPLIYSLNRERSPYNTELTSVSAALADHYALTEIGVLGTDYTSAMRKPPKPGKTARERDELGYRHVVGRLAAASSAARTAAAGGAASPARVTARPRVVLGMTLYNNARHLREAMDSLLAQTYEDFALVLLDDASADDTESIARDYVMRDPRVRYHRHRERRAMIATWREVAEIAGAECPSARYFAWVSDHDRWHPEWLARMVAVLDEDPETVLAYPITRRLTPAGEEIDKGPRLFDTASCRTLGERWTSFCHHGVGAGDMVYGLMRIDALRRAGIFRTILRPDRLLIAELTLHGRVRQVPDVLWFRRQSMGTSVERQRHTLVLAGEEPRWFSTPPWFQHSIALWREYARSDDPPVRIPRTTWMGMLIRYQLTYGWRHFRKTSTSHAIGRAYDRLRLAKKMTRHHYHRAVYETLVGARVMWGRTKRVARRSLYRVLVLTHRLGLRGGHDAGAS